MLESRRNSAPAELKLPTFSRHASAVSTSPPPSSTRPKPSPSLSSPYPRMARRRLHRPATHLPFERGPVKAYDMMSELHNSFRAPPDDVIRHHARPTRVKTALALEGDRLFTTMSMEDFHGEYQPRTRPTRLQDSFLGFVDDASSLPDRMSLSQTSSVSEASASRGSAKSDSATFPAPVRVASRTSVGVQVYSVDDALTGGRRLFSGASQSQQSDSLRSVYVPPPRGQLTRGTWTPM